MKRAGGHIVSRLLLGVALLLAASLTAGAAGAQTASREADAQQLFDEGRKLALAGNYAEACVKFATSDELAPSGGAVLNLADCYEKTGRTASAWVKFRATAERADAAGRPDVAKMARDRAELLAPRLPKLALVVEEGARVPGLEIRRDGEVLPTGEWGAELPVDPGHHEIVATAPHRERFAQSVDVREGDRIVVRVAPLPEEASRPADNATTGDTPSSPLRTVGIAVGGVGIVGLGLGTVFGLRAIAKHGDVDNACPSGVCPDEATRTRAREDNDAAKSSATLSTVAFTAGAVCLAAGVTLYLVAPRGTKRDGAGAWRLVPSASSNGGALFATGAF